MPSPYNLTGLVKKEKRYCFAHHVNADIWEGKYRGIFVVVKVLRCLPVDNSVQHRLAREIEAWTALNHPNITPFFGICFDFDSPGVPSLIAPYYRNGNILNYTKQNPEVDKLSLITQVANALSHLHSQSIIHGNVNGTNVLVNDNLEASLTDFGISRILQKASSFKAFDMPGSFEEITTPTTLRGWRWKARELMMPSDENGPYKFEATKAVDVWAFAMTVIEIFTGRIPFWYIRSDTKVIYTVMTGGRPERSHYSQINTNIWETLKGCWDQDPAHRPSMEEVMQFFVSVSS
ncbi:hypothetical protein PILCRDRAFT_824481 [Piloderma croceum F 1598]|uniref:Protein kinase domain-containing protein n=1 Tax=Piloderma croceum (strain F 1598) TaxID=765440 RepID=A0A0C3AW77_PILCF|nr:hypothetical protein PILCRDRAFT_824481 [Piloderma croceum F 1598]